MNVAQHFFIQTNEQKEGPGIQFYLMHHNKNKYIWLAVTMEKYTLKVVAICLNSTLTLKMGQGHKNSTSQ